MVGRGGGREGGRLISTVYRYHYLTHNRDHIEGMLNVR